MAPRIQPIVAIRQQPIVVSRSVSLHRMRVKTKEQVKKEFSGRLRARLDALNIAPRKQIGYLHGRLRKNVSRETCRKWHRGLEMPDEANWDVLASAVEVSAHYLRFGEHQESNDDGLNELVDLWYKLTANDREYVLAAARMALRAQTGQQGESSPFQQRRPVSVHEPHSTYSAGRRTSNRS